MTNKQVYYLTSALRENIIHIKLYIELIKGYNLKLLERNGEFDCKGLGL